jgi:hypothetical protein
MGNPELQTLVNNGKALTVNSNIQAYVDRVKQLSKNDQTYVLTQVKSSYHASNKGNVWSKLSKTMSGGKRKTRKSKKSRKSKKTRKH